MTLGARLAKVEEKAARVIRCAWCRVSLVDDHQQQARGRAVTADYVMRSCPFCGNEFRVPLEGLTARERESFVLWGYTHGGETYRDERAYAAQEWWNARAWVRILTSPLDEVRRRVAARKGSDKPDRYALERGALKAEAEELRKAEERRQRRLYGPRTFPLAATLRGLKAESKALDAPSYSPGFVRRTPAEQLARQVLIHARRMEACEVVLWGAVEPETAALIEAREAEVAAFDEARARVLEENERAERERREEAARRERERQERAAVQPGGYATPPAAPTPDAPRPRFRVDPTAPVPRNPMVIDPTAAHVPEPARMVTFSDPADPSKRMVPGRSIGPETYDENHPDAVQFQRSTPEELPDHQKYYRGEYYDGDRRY